MLLMKSLVSANMKEIARRRVFFFIQLNRRHRQGHEGGEDLRLALSTLSKGWRKLREDINQRETEKDVKQRAESADSSVESIKEILNNSYLVTRVSSKHSDDGNEESRNAVKCSSTILLTFLFIKI